MRCVEVTESRTARGYGHGTIGVGGGKYYSLYSHRVAFEQAWGITLRPEQVVRHSCDNVACINPLHLMVGTQKHNIDDMVLRGRHAKQKTTHCPKGHAYSEDNTYRNKGGRWCRSCTRERQRL
jgi:hypothetical protein